MCFDSWKKKKNGKNLGKNLFNFHVDSDVNPYGQRPLNDDEFRADVVDTKKAAEKENDVPTSKYPSERSQVSQRFLLPWQLISFIKLLKASHSHCGCIGYD